MSTANIVFRLDISNEPGVDQSLSVSPNVLGEDWSTISSPTGQADVATVIFDNQSDSSVSVLWVDFDGQRIEYSNLNLSAGEPSVQNTFAGHLWEVIQQSDQTVVARFRSWAAHSFRSSRSDKKTRRAALSSYAECHSQQLLQVHRHNRDRRIDTDLAEKMLNRKILAQLQSNARMSHQELSERVGLTATPCARRIRNLEAAKVITGYTTMIDEASVGYGFSVFVSVRLDRQVDDRLVSFEDAIPSMPEVVDCWLMTGNRDYLLRIAARDIHEFEHFLTGQLTSIEGVAAIESSIPIRRVKQQTARFF